MMIVVVSDTSPLNYLVAIGLTNVLEQLFTRIVIPPAVAAELVHPAAPPQVRELIYHRPTWLEVVQPDEQRVRQIRTTCRGLGPGETEAICLAVDLHAAYLLTDDGDARRQAETICRLHVTGTLGILDLAAASNLIDLGDAVKRLRATNLRYPESAVQNLLDKDAQRRQSQSRSG